MLQRVTQKLPRSLLDLASTFSYALHHSDILAATNRSSIFKPSSPIINLPSLACFPPKPPPAYSCPRERSISETEESLRLLLGRWKNEERFDDSSPIGVDAFELPGRLNRSSLTETETGGAP